MKTLSQSQPAGLILGALLAVLLGGCASSAGPSEAAAREVFEDRLRDGLSQGAIRVNSFQKTSEPVNVPPGDTYVVAFRAELECMKDYSGFYCGRGCKQGTRIRVEEGAGRTKISYDHGDDGNRTATMTQQGTNLTTGTAVTQTYGSGLRLSSYEEENKWAGLKFTKTWRGWHAEGGKLY